MIEKIVHTAKHTMNDNVLEPMARYWSPLVTSRISCILLLGAARLRSYPCPNTMNVDRTITPMRITEAVYVR